MATIKEKQYGLDELQGMAPEAEEPSLQRDKVIIRTSVIGILANVFLASFKAFIGIISNSIAIVLDAVNNLSDAASSLITIIGTKLAGREPDRQHPFGYGRIEYLSALVISMLVLYAGITSFTESVRRILSPEVPDYSPATLIIVAAGVFVKIVLGRYVKGVGEKVNSDSLVNSGEDAVLDSVISASTLAAAALYLWKGISLEAWLGAVISLVIIKAGIEMLKETLSRLLGERADIELARSIRKTVQSFPGVSGAYDLIMHNYGPDTYNASVHIEVPENYTAGQLDELIRDITMKVYQEHKVILTAVGIYSRNVDDPDAVRMRDRIGKAVFEEPNILQMHGFYVDEKTKTIRFDVVISFDEPDRHALQVKLTKKVQELYPDYRIQVVPDTDFSES